MPLVEKEIIGPATHFYRDEATGAPRKLVVTPELTRYWHEQGNKMLGMGLTVPVPCEHDFQAHPMTPAEKLKNNAGWVKEYKLKNVTDPKTNKERKDVLFGVVDVQDAEIAKKLPNTIRWTSPWISSFTDGQGRDWKNVIAHLALTTRPRIIDQAPFGSIAAALSMAKPDRLSAATIGVAGSKQGFTLSKAGELLTSVKKVKGKNRTVAEPAYPIAFSLYSGVALNTEHDKATGQFTGPGGDHADVSKKKKVGDWVVHPKLKKRGRVSHVYHDNEHKDRGKLVEVDYGAGPNGHGSHIVNHREHDIGHSKDQNSKWASKSHEAAMAIGDEEDDDLLDLSDDDDGDEGDEGDTDAPPFGKGAGEGGGDDLLADQVGDIPPPAEDQGDTIPITELLSQLLPILGVQMPDARFITSDTFMRELCTAMIAKVTMLAQQQTQPPGGQPPQTTPPPPKPAGQQPPNPLIQQEQQPMYMSLEEIQKIADPTMKGIALSMYNENVKLRGEVDANAKTANSLRDSKLKDENAKRSSRVQLLGKLSPRVKADLDAMLALPAMALSMGEGGSVVDPMAQTLSVLEKGLADMPRLLTSDQSAFAVMPQPTDADMLSAEQEDALADNFARSMGCPPVQKKAG